MAFLYPCILGILFLASSSAFAELLVLGNGVDKPNRHIWYAQNNSALMERFCKDYPQIKQGTGNLPEGPCVAKPLTHDHEFPHKLGSNTLRTRVLNALNRLSTDEKLRSELLSENNQWHLALEETSTLDAINEMLSLVHTPDKLEKESEIARTTDNALSVLELARSEGLEIAPLERELSKQLNQTAQTLEKRVQHRSIETNIEEMIAGFERLVLDERLKVVGRYKQQRDVLSFDDPEILAAVAELVFRNNAQKLGSSIALEVSFYRTNAPLELYINNKLDQVTYFTGGSKYFMNSATVTAAVYETEIFGDRKAIELDVEDYNTEHLLRFETVSLPNSLRERRGVAPSNMFEVLKVSSKNEESIVALLSRMEADYSNSHDDVRLEFWLLRD